MASCRWTTVNGNGKAASCSSPRRSGTWMPRRLCGSMRPRSSTRSASTSTRIRSRRTPCSPSSAASTTSPTSNITLPSGIVINAKETTEDMYSSIDLAAARIERQVRKWKDKIRDHKPHGGPSTSVREMVIHAGGGRAAGSKPDAQAAHGAGPARAARARLQRHQGRTVHGAVDDRGGRGDAAEPAR